MYHKRFSVRSVVLCMALFSVAMVTLLYALQDKLVYFRYPSELLAKKWSHEQRLRIGGLVLVGSLIRRDGMKLSFVITDEKASIPVTYTGVVPDLFGENKGVVVEGYYMSSDGVFVADKVFVKHDEQYKPKQAPQKNEKFNEVPYYGKG